MSDNMEQNKQILIQMQAEIEDYKNKKSRLEGEEEGLLKQMQTTLGVSSVEQLQSQVKQYEKDIKETHEKFEQHLERLIEAYPWKTVKKPLTN